jgi:exosortase
LLTAQMAHAWPQVASLAVLALCLLWAFWPTLAAMVDRWSHDPQYSHGFLVPVFAAVVLWHRRDLMPARTVTNWWGLAVLGAGAALHLAGGVFGVEALDALALLPSVAGLCLLLGGWGALRWAWPAIAFLGFMLPLPFRAEVALAHPLRRLATVCSTYCLQTLGYPALAEGNIIYIDEVKLGVVEACSGLGMLMTFFALSTAVALMLERRLADKLVIVASAVVIAVIANVTRITATGAVHCTWGPGAGQFLHDWAGWLMMPLALGLLWLELQFLDRLFVTAAAAAPLPIDFTGTAGALPYPRREAAPLSAPLTLNTEPPPAPRAPQR